MVFLGTLSAQGFSYHLSAHSLVGFRLLLTCLMQCRYGQAQSCRPSYDSYNAIFKLFFLRKYLGVLEVASVCWLLYKQQKQCIKSSHPSATCRKPPPGSPSTLSRVGCMWISRTLLPQAGRAPSPAGRGREVAASVSCCRLSAAFSSPPDGSPSHHSRLPSDVPCQTSA